MASKAQIVAEARTWVGTPWLHQGRTRIGIDCAGLVVLVGRAMELTTYDSTGYQRRTQGQTFLVHFREQMRQKPIPDAEPGDVLLFREAGYPCHSSIVGDRPAGLTIIHAHAFRRKVVEELLAQGDWLERRVACFEFKGLDEY